MIVFPEQVDVTYSDSDAAMTSQPTAKISPDCDVESQTHACSSPDCGGKTEDTVTLQSAVTFAEASHGVSECTEVQSKQVSSGVKRRSDSSKEIRFEDVAEEVKIIKRVESRLRSAGTIGPGMLDDCSKLVCDLSRELAVLHGLSQGIGVDTDCPKLRQQLLFCQRRACTLARSNSLSLVPLVRRKTNLSTEQVVKVEKMYRIYSGCLEYLLYLLRKVRSLRSHFRLSQETCFFIRTGITDPADVSKSASAANRTDDLYLPKPAERSPKDAPQAPERGDSVQMSGDIKSMQQLLVMVTNACDTHPWQVGEEEEEEVEERNKEGGGQKDGLGARSMAFRFSIKRQSRKSTATRTSKSTEEEKGKLLDSEAIAEPELELSETPAAGTRTHIQSKAQKKKTSSSKRCCGVCLMLCGRRGNEDDDLSDDGAEGTDGLAEETTAAEVKGHTGTAGGEQLVHIVVTDSDGNPCPQEEWEGEGRDPKEVKELFPQVLIQ